jgi:tRNA-binding protein
MQTIDLEDFKKIDIRVGTVLRVELFEKARKPAYQVWVDLGAELGIKKSSAQLTVHYQPEELLGKQVLCVCNLAPRQVADFMSEVLITGFSSSEGGIWVATSDQPVPNGAALH